MVEEQECFLLLKLEGGLLVQTTAEERRTFLLSLASLGTGPGEGSGNQGQEAGAGAAQQHEVTPAFLAALNQRLARGPEELAAFAALDRSLDAQERAAWLAGPGSRCELSESPGQFGKRVLLLAALLCWKAPSSVLR